MEESSQGRWAQWWEDRGERVRFVVVTALATAAAWGFAHLVGLPQPPVASVGAVLSVQLTSHQSLIGGARRSASVLAGMLVAVVAYRVLGGSGPVLAALLSVIGLGGGLALGLPEDSGRAVVSAGLFMFLSAPQATWWGLTQYGLESLAGVMVGALASSLVHPDTAPERARGALADLSCTISDLLGDLGTAITAGYDEVAAQQWLARARSLAERVERAEEMVAAARAHARWALSASERDISNEVTALRTLRLSATQTVGIARALYDAAGDASLAAMPELADALSHAGEAFAAHSSAVRGGGGAITPAIQRAGQRARSAGERLVELGDPAALVAAGSIVADLTRMVDQLARAEGSDDDARGWDELMAWRRDEQARSLREARGEP